MEERDYYEVLHLHPSADHAMVAQAYWYLARKYKAAMDQDAFMEHAIAELNRSFDVLGSAESRAAYDRKRASRMLATPEPRTTKRVSIEVSFWSLPAWQGMLSATAAIALTVVALAAGAQPLAALLLATVAVGASLVTLPSHFASSADARWTLGRKRWRRDLRIVKRCELRVPARHQNQLP